MKKITIFLILILVLGFFANQKITAQSEALQPLPTKSSRVSLNKGPLAGRIIDLRATKIRALESVGFICPVDGQTIEIKKQKETHKYPTSYFIPSYVQAKYQPASGKLILGYYSGTFTIVCTHPAGAVETVILDSIQKYNVSKSSLGIFQF